MSGPRPSRRRVRLLVRTLLALAVVTLLLVPPPALAAPSLPTISGWPLAGDVTVLQRFDPPATPYGRGHRGVDLAAGVGTPVLAAAGGRIVFAGKVAGRGVVVVSHGALRTTYEPVSARVPVGAEVVSGQTIGVVTAGSRCGDRSCLHWGLLEGTTYLDPLTLVPGSSLTFQGPVRLLPASSIALARSRADGRVLAAQRARARQGGTGPSGAHGFLQPVPGAVTSGYGRRFHPVLKVSKLHDGTDFGAACGVPIRASSSGTVTRAVVSRAYGHRLFVDHGQVDGRHVVTSYNHAQRYVVGVGTRVSRGQVLGYVGATGYATGCHLHLMVWLDQRLVNPMSWL